MPSFSVISRHKILSAVALVAVLGGGCYYYRSTHPAAPTVRYVTAPVQKGTLVLSVAGSGQVASSDQIDVKPKVSGTLTSIPVAEGQTVATGAIIARIDSKDAARAVRDAEVNLETAKLQLEELQKPADALTLLQAQNSLIQAQQNLQKDQDALGKTFDDGFTHVANTFLDLPDIMTGLDDTLHSNKVKVSQSNVDAYVDAASFYDSRARSFGDDAEAKYQTARAAYDKNFQDFKNVSRSSSTDVIEAMIGETYATTLAVSESLKSANNLITFTNDTLKTHGQSAIAVSATQLANLNGYTSKVNGHLSDLYGDESDLKNGRDNIIADQRTIAERSASLDKLKQPPDALAVRADQIAITQKQNALSDAQEALADYTIRAPFDGVIASIPVQKGQDVSSGTVLATLIAKQKIATVSLNEVDVAKVKVGEQVTLTFDAISDLSLTGKVSQIDAIGTISQGVVSYGVQVAMDSQDDRVKPGMNVSASIITLVKPDVLIVPNSAIKTNGSTTVEVMVNGAVSTKDVTVGISNDTSTEIVSGLNEGDAVVTQTITSATAAPAAATAGGNRGGLPFIGGFGGGGPGR